MSCNALPQNCSYYWGFAAFVSYFINHPLYSPPCQRCLPLGVHILTATFCTQALVLLRCILGWQCSWYSIHCSDQEYEWLLVFILFPQVCEYGNLSIHTALRDLRPAGYLSAHTSTVSPYPPYAYISPTITLCIGTKERKIPMPTSNPMTHLFSFVSCPNYTYEVQYPAHYPGATVL